MRLGQRSGLGLGASVSSRGLFDYNTAIRFRLHLRNEPVSPPRQCFDVARVLGIVVEHLAQLLDVGIQAVFEVNDGVIRPEVFAEFLASDEFAGMFQQNRKNGDGLALELELRTVLPQLSRLPVEFKRSETDPLCGWNWQAYPTVATTAARVAQAWNNLAQGATPISGSEPELICHCWFGVRRWRL